MEEEIKNLLGESYQEGMTGEQVQAAFKKMLLSTGEYVNKDNADARARDLENNYKAQIKALNDTLNSKMSDEEKTKAAQKARDDEFEQMKQLLSQTRLDSSRGSALSNIAEAKLLSGIEEGDKDYDEFISSIVSEDNEKTSKVSKYIAKMVKNAYEKGKSDLMKNNLGNMGKEGKNPGGDDETEVDAKVKALAEKLKTQNKSYYFNKN